ncbi:MAG: outer membrane lipoprotein-sorting protein [Petrotogales bacterium]
MLNKIKNNNQYFIISVIIGLFFVLSLNVGASQQLTADEIIDKVKENQADYQNSKSQAEMVLIDQDDKEEIREIIMFEKDEGDDKVTMLMRFLSPKSVERVTLLSIENGEKIYLYMPAYQKPRRIAGSSKQENFMGTDFSYEDLSMDYQNDDYAKELLEETNEQYVLEILPDDEELSYIKFILYVNKEKFYVEKVEFYDLDEQHTKTLEIQKVEFDEEGKFTPMKMELNNLIDNHKTQMNIKEIKYDLDLSDSFFSIRNLQKPVL